MNPEAKLVFIHQRNSWYLPYALYQSRYISPDSEVVLIGESKYPDVTCVSLDRLADCAQAKEFRTNYVHMSSNPAWYELICFLRWFYLLEYMRSSRVQSVLYLDSDVLLFSSMKDLARQSTSLGAGVARGACLFHQGRGTAGISYWTQEGLHNFCQCLLNCYRQKEKITLLQDIWQRFVTTGTPGGICDMTPISLFYSPDADSLADLARIEGGVFDCGINVSSNYVENEYVMRRGMKKMIFRDRIPYFEKNDTSRTIVRAHALHFQGEAKGDMPLYYTGGCFKDKMLHDLKGFVYRLRRDIRGKKF